ncbi:ATP-binding cassette, subfamily B [Treponema bryantii]|uniref:ATP-binding cassette, subfamily B n=1 Tax=Treponema bryantii TaxID=163 RepID=A0A1I3KC10_9SPIR|nr:ABC transporter ATP-binding protein [Treponema bryantii]SFI69987.1 ATP-binding cassette, subfamily B [Treponema bryantii]
MKNSNTIRKVLSLIHRLRRGYISLVFISRVIAAAQPFVGIIFSSKIIDLLIQRAPASLIMKYALILVTSTAILNALEWGMKAFITVGEQVLNEKINQMISEKTCRIDYDILEKHETLDMIKKAQEGMNSRGGIQSFCTNLAAGIQNIVTIIYSIILLVPVFIPAPSAGLTGIGNFVNKWYSVFILILAIGMNTVMNMLDRKLEAKVQQSFFERNVVWNRRYSYWFTMVFNYSLGKYIRLYDMQKMLSAKVGQASDNMENEFYTLRDKLLKISWIPIVVNVILQFVTYAYVGLKAVFKLISVGDSMKYVGAYTNLAQSVQNIAGIFTELDIESKYLAYFYDYMAIENKRYEGTIPTEKRDDNVFEIEFRDVSFKYLNTETYALRHVNQKITLGSKTAVVGKNGAGKTTFIKLLCRLYEPTEGQILLNGVDIRYYDYKDYAKLFGVVFQDFNLFSATIGENVASSDEYDEKLVIECLDKAGFGERLAKMPDGIRTNIYQYEENGVEISGGEAQKLAIARALYKNAPFVILDEPTSALDPVAEYEIYQHFDQMVEDKTSIYISHRMSSCRFCDNILVFDEGQIIESGSHEELMKEGGLYSELWNAQAQYYA